MSALAPMLGAAEDTWTPGPLQPRLAESAVHVWRADLATVSDDVIDLLCGDEIARADRFLSEGAGRMWARARGLLRALLGRYLHRDPSALCFSTGLRGKPALLAVRPPSDARASIATRTPAQLSFSLSHSRALALFAVTEIEPVGVDVEVARRPRNEVALAARVFGPVQARRLEGLEPAIRAAEFLRMWVRHEAECKRRGTGLAGRGHGDRWISELDVGSCAAGAVALARRPRELCCWDWRS